MAEPGFGEHGFRKASAAARVGRRINLNAPLIRPIAPLVVFGVNAYAFARVLTEELNRKRVGSGVQRKNTTLHYTGATLPDRNR